jgi:uncharacterized caspase-like protein
MKKPARVLFTPLIFLLLCIVISAVTTSESLAQTRNSGKKSGGAATVKPAAAVKADKARILVILADPAGTTTSSAKSLLGALAAGLKEQGWNMLSLDELSGDEKVMKLAAQGKLDAALSAGRKAGAAYVLLASSSHLSKPVNPAGVSLVMVTAELSGKLYDTAKGSQVAVVDLLERASAPEDAVAMKDANRRLAAAVISELPRGGAKASLQVVGSLDELGSMPSFGIKENTANVAVVIGIEKYRTLPSSDYSRQDAEKVAEYLGALGFPRRNIELITDERATRTDMEKALEVWLPSRLKPGGKVLIYYSGHGSPNPTTGEGFLVPYDGDPNYLAVTGYPLKRLYEKLGALSANQVVVVIDACFSGTGGRSVLAKGARPITMKIKQEARPPSVRILTSSEGGQISLSDPERGHGIFTYHFLTALKGGKRDLAEIYDFIRPRVEDDAKKQNVEQQPGITPETNQVKGVLIGG